MLYIICIYIEYIIYIIYIIYNKPFSNKCRKSWIASRVLPSGPSCTSCSSAFPSRAMAPAPLAVLTCISLGGL